MKKYVVQCADSSESSSAKADFVVKIYSSKEESSFPSVQPMPSVFSMFAKSIFYIKPCGEVVMEAPKKEGVLAVAPARFKQ